MENNTEEKATGPKTMNNELTIEQREVEGLSLGQVVRRRFFKHKGAMISLGVLGVILVLVYSSIGFNIDKFYIHGWWKWGYESAGAIVNGGNPTFKNIFDWGEHPFGQDEIGRDIFARVMRGTQQSVTVMVLFGAIMTVSGIVVGALAGYYGGWVDQVLMRFTDLIIVVPSLVLFSVIGQAFGNVNAAVLGMMLGLFSWMGMARLVRGEFLSLREREFVDAARVAGASDLRIIFRHILPNALGVVIVSGTLGMGSAIIIEASLSFIGFGIQKPDVSLGQLINEYQGAFQTRPWLFWFPSLFIVAIALAINFIGDGLRDAFDPRQRSKPKFSLREVFTRRSEETLSTGVQSAGRLGGTELTDTATKDN